MSNSQKQILRYCLANSKDDLGERIFRRVSDKNSAFKEYFEGLSRAEKVELADGLRQVVCNILSTLNLRQFIVKMVEQATDMESLESLSRNFGCSYANLDFKPDFVQIANSLTTECVFLDAAVHPTTETLSAW